MRREISSKTHVGLACLGLFVTSLFLTAYSAKNPAIARLGTSVVLKGITPVLLVADGLRTYSGNLWNGYVNLVNTTRQNDELRAEVRGLQSRVAVLSEAERENLRLRELLQFSSERQLRGVTASVIGGDPSGWVKGVVVDKGSSSGIAPGMAVIHPQGVVGQVVSVTASSARVLLVSDHASGVDVLMETSRARGVVEGAGEQVCELKFVTKDVSVRVGEQVITSGMDGVYPKGLLVGQVAQVGNSAAGLFQPVEIKPAVDFARLEEVLLVPSAASAAGTAVLNYPAQGLAKGGE
jgi:rod shape-determining protein MreC